MKPRPDSSRSPGAGGEEMIPTLNGMGCMCSSLDEISQAFVDFAAAAAPGPALDVGAAFGVATLEALRRGAVVAANDVEPRHLEELERRVPVEDHPRLTLLPGTFPDDLPAGDGGFGAVLLSRVLHFFDPAAVERSAQWLYRALAPGGKAFVVTEASLFLDAPELRAAYEARLKAGEAWPGYLANARSLLPRPEPTMPEAIHYLDPPTLRRTFEAQGFVIECVDTFRRVVSSRQRESVGMIARR